MDEVVTCRCGNQSWVIGTAGIRCSKCELALPLRFKFPVHDANRVLEADNAHEAKKRMEEDEKETH